MNFHWRPVYKWIFHRLGWSIEGNFPTEYKKYIIVVAPHTSNWDFLVGLCVRSICRIKAHYVAKAELFKWPFGLLFRYLGGYPVNRSKSNNFVDAVVDIFNEKEDFIISITPEGTRKHNDNWKSGFYHIAQKAGIPLVTAAFDYPTKRVILGAPFFPDKDVDTTIQELKSFFKQYRGKIPEYGVI
jgi:1-acyl-sn-glycerol-3-phosphate acyltransferase